eukprot:TRINITY_DN2246_c0_g1_i1.p1 TRINITY_DN2246_c0_g1~~TRINITY_DN2246_c0_g1_i1.p1  ORF type:complete len:577 (+),score=67.26 TRINITY_DN2246_c0_g1_i1:86-1816(+)
MGLSGYSARPLRPADDQVVRRWRKDTDMGVAGYAVLGHSQRSGYKERLQKYKEWRALMLVREVGSTSVPVACCGWGLKRVKFKDEYINVAYLMDGMVSPDDKQALQLAIKGESIHSWRSLLDGEYATCCTNGKLTNVTLEMLLENGLCMIGSCRMYTWSGSIQKDLGTKVYPKHGSLKIVRMKSDPAIIPFMNEIFKNQMLCPEDLTEIAGNASYVDTIIMRSDEEWATVSRWDQNLTAPMFVVGGKAKIKYQILFCCNCSGDQNLLKEVITMAATDAFDADECGLVTCIIDDSFQIVKTALEEAGASCLKYATAMKLNSSGVSAACTPAFWDPRDFATIFSFVRHDTSLLPTELQTDYSVIPINVLRFMKVVTPAVHVEAPIDDRKRLKQIRKAEVPETNSHALLQRDDSSDVRAVSVLLYLFMVATLAAVMSTVRLLPYGKPLNLLEISKSFEFVLWVLVKVWCVTSDHYVAVLTCELFLFMDFIKAGDWFTAVDILLSVYLLFRCCKKSGLVKLPIVLTLLPEATEKAAETSVVTPFFSTIITMSCSVVCLRIGVAVVLMQTITALNNFFALV